ncbi:snaclec EMS16 subunit alpha-like [Asterias amurensis]|uniref:snaclec EMS16 subunit alpha-like n=1 Tax=Asterias amurensis TaxID=7602 RepID=UPI003AB75015
MNFIGVLLLLVGCYSTTMAAICPTDWQRYGEACYFIIKKTLTWYVARDTCIKSHADLAVPKSQMEQTYIWNTYADLHNGQPTIGIWIGCNDDQEEGAWHPCGLRGQADPYENWEDDYPTSSDDNCVVISKFHGRWRNKPCSKMKSAACERPLDARRHTPFFCLQTGPDGRVESQCLVGHVMKELLADGVVSCGKACRSEPRCRSFNLLMEEGPGKMVCQLNNASLQEAADADIVDKENCYLSDL